MRRMPSGCGSIPCWRSRIRAALLTIIALHGAAALEAKPAHKQSLKRRYGDLLPRALDSCTTCHLTAGTSGGTLVSAEAMPPHNSFGARLRALGKELGSEGRPAGLGARLRGAAGEDSDGDGVANEIEILAGRAPGDPADVPSPVESASAIEKQRQLREKERGASWEPFERVTRPPLPDGISPGAHPIDAFLTPELERRGLVPRPEAPPAVLARRLYLDLIGLPPTPEEVRSYEDDRSPDAYEKLVDRLLESPRHGERWARHWMDVWRYSDWAGWGNQVRDSQPHVWRWRDWIIESLNEDKGYDRMVLEMLAGDEIAPLDRDTLRATGYLVRSFKLLSREAWMQEAVDHCAQAFLGVTLGCARCHDHLYDPIAQEEYYRFRAIFDPYSVRVDRIPGRPDTAKDGLARAYDKAPDAKTHLFLRGDDRKPDTSRALAPGVPAALGGPRYEPEPVTLPLEARIPAKSGFVIRETVAAAEESAVKARAAFEESLVAEAAAEEALRAAAPEKKAEAEGSLAKARAAREDAELAWPAAEASRDALDAVLEAERLEDEGVKEKDPGRWKAAAMKASSAQRRSALLHARRERASADRALGLARAAKTGAKDGKKAEADEAAAAKKLEEAEKALAKARAEAAGPASDAYTRRPIEVHPETSSGRRLALARWIAHRENPLAARVVVNHMWLRRFGRALAATPADLGQNGAVPLVPALLDWLAVELMEPSAAAPGRPWSMKRMHRLMVTSAAYRRSSTPDARNIALDPDDLWLWRMPPRRLEAEVVRDAILHAGGGLDPALGGPELDQKLALSTRRRSIYYRNAPEKQSEFLQLFDMAAPAECYERRTSIVPQQALALTNGPLTRGEARAVAALLSSKHGGDPSAFTRAAFERVLARPPTTGELAESLRFLESGEARAAGPRAGEDFVHALFNLHEFITVR